MIDDHFASQTPVQNRGQSIPAWVGFPRQNPRISRGKKWNCDTSQARTPSYEVQIEQGGSAAADELSQRCHTVISPASGSSPVAGSAPAAGRKIRMSIRVRLFALIVLAAVVMPALCPAQTEQPTRSAEAAKLLKSDPLHVFSESVQQLSGQVTKSVVQVLTTGFGLSSDDDKTDTAYLEPERGIGAGVVLSADGLHRYQRSRHAGRQENSRTSAGLGKSRG